MNVNYILYKNYIKINEQKVRIGYTFEEIETLARKPLLISKKNTESIIVSEGDFQLYFRNNIFYMWTISPGNLIKL